MWVVSHLQTDVVCGVVVTPKDPSPQVAAIAAQLRLLQGNVGAVASPFDCWLCMRGLRSLSARMRMHCSNAMAVANFLANHPAVESVLYPGHPSHPQHELAVRQAAAAAPARPCRRSAGAGAGAGSGAAACGSAGSAASPVAADNADDGASSVCSSASSTCSSATTTSTPPSSQRQLLFGGMMAVILKGGRDPAVRVAAALKVFTRATSLGGTESHIEHRASSEGKGTSTPQGLLRISVGLEDAEDLLDDLHQALASLGEE